MKGTEISHKADGLSGAEKGGTPESGRQERGQSALSREADFLISTSRPALASSSGQGLAELVMSAPISTQHSTFVELDKRCSRAPSPSC